MHDGYKVLGVKHSRKFVLNERTVTIKDKISKKLTHSQVAYFHLHPTITTITIENSKVIIENEKIERQWHFSCHTVLDENFTNLHPLFVFVFLILITIDVMNHSEKNNDEVNERAVKFIDLKCVLLS